MDPVEKRSVASPAMAAALTFVGEALTRLRYGTIQLTVHDGRVMQIDVTERTRLAD